MLKMIYEYEGSYVAFNRSKGGKLFKITVDGEIVKNPWIYDYDNCLSYPVDGVYMQIIINNSKETGVKLPW